MGYNWVSPGAAAGSAIEEVLTRRREEERQRLLDEITAKNSEVQRQATEANIRAQNERQERERLGIAMGGWEPGEDLSTKPQDIQDLAKRYGLTRGRPEDGGIGLPGGIPASAGGMMGPDPADHQNYYVGSPDDRERDRRSKVLRQLEQEIQDPSLNETQRLFKVARAEADTGANFGAGIYGALADPRPEKEEGWYPVLNPDGSETGNWAPKGAHFLPREPREPRDTGSYVGPALDKDNKPIPGKAVMIQNGRLRVVDIEGAEGVGSRTPPGGGRGSQGIIAIPAALRTDLSNKRRDAGKPGGQAALNQSIENIISDALQRKAITPDVALTVRDIISKDLSPTPQGWMDWVLRKPSKAVPTLEQILGTYNEGDFDSPEEYSQFADLISTIY